MKKLMLSALLIVGAGVASAKADVSVGISFRLPTFHPPMVIARAVEPVVCAPAPRVVYAPPVVCAPAPVVYVPRPVYYGRPYGYYRGHSYSHGRPHHYYRHDSRSERYHGDHRGSHGGHRR